MYNFSRKTKTLNRPNVKLRHMGQNSPVATAVAQKAIFAGLVYQGNNPFEKVGIGGGAKRFTITITGETGSGAADRNVYIFGGVRERSGALTTAANGLLRNGAQTGFGNASINVTTDKWDLATLRQTLREAPHRLEYIHIKGSSAVQTGTPFKYSTFDVFKDSSEVNTIAVDDATSASDSNDKLIKVSLEHQIDGEQELMYNIQAGQTVTITFIFGTSISLAQMLKDQNAVWAQMGLVENVWTENIRNSRAVPALGLSNAAPGIPSSL